MSRECSELINKIEKKEKLTFDEFIMCVSFGLELQFYYKKRKFGTTQFDGFEFYEWDLEEGYQSYPNLKEFKEKANIDGKVLSDIWDDVSRINFAD